MKRSIVKPPRRKDKIGPFETVDFIIFAMCVAGIAWPILEITENIFLFRGRRCRGRFRNLSSYQG